MASDQCPACAAPVSVVDVFCEACGQNLSEPAPARTSTAAAAAPGVTATWITSAGPPEACPACGGAEFGPEGYCEACGQRRPYAHWPIRGH